MSTLLVGTRKGLFVLDTDGADRAATALAGPHFPAVRVSAVLADPRDGAWYVALDHGHFGTKLHRSDDRGATWTELPAPEYPADAGPVPNSRVDPTAPASLKMVWCLEAAHAAQPGTIFAGTVPGGLFRSDDHGATWALVRSMWDHPDRPKGNGGGYDEPGIHSISVDLDEADYQAMIDTYLSTEDKEWLEATVTIDGETYEQAGIRLKGN